jgi:hypothetical protein
MQCGTCTCSAPCSSAKRGPCQPSAHNLGTWTCTQLMLVSAVIACKYDPHLCSTCSRSPVCGLDLPPCHCRHPETQPLLALHFRQCADCVLTGNMQLIRGARVRLRLLQAQEASQGLPQVPKIQDAPQLPHRQLRRFLPGLRTHGVWWVQLGPQALQAWAPRLQAQPTQEEWAGSVSSSHAAGLCMQPAGVPSQQPHPQDAAEEHPLCPWCTWLTPAARHSTGGWGCQYLGAAGCWWQQVGM